MMFWRKHLAAKREAARIASAIAECRYGHTAGNSNMVVNPISRDRLSCMFCPKDIPIPESATITRGGSLGGGWDTVGLHNN